MPRARVGGGETVRRGVTAQTPMLIDADVVDLIERGMSPSNSWQVRLDESGDLVWTNDEETTNRQPARSFWQRVQDFFFRAVPKEYY